MGTACFAPVRGSAVRVTELTKNGAVPATMRAASSRSVVKITIDEITEASAPLHHRDEYGSLRLRSVKSDQLLRYEIGVDFLRVDPGLLHLLTGVPLVHDVRGNVVGFDAPSLLVGPAFALEVWSRLAGRTTEYGYTLFPFLKGGRLSGFVFENGLVSFNLRQARTMGNSQWGRGPYNTIQSDSLPMDTAVSGNTSWRSIIVSGSPPEQYNGIQTWEPPIEFGDIIYGGRANYSSAYVIEGGNASTSSSDIINGGVA